MDRSLLSLRLSFLCHSDNFINVVINVLIFTMEVSYDNSNYKITFKLSWSAESFLRIFYFCSYLLCQFLTDVPFFILYFKGYQIILNGMNMK